MTRYNALIRVAPIATIERRLDPSWTPGRMLWDARALRFLTAARTTIPLLVDHLDDAEIGYVREIVQLPDTTGPWLFGRAVVTDGPAWLKPGTAASLGQKILSRASFHDDLVTSAILEEISVLSPGTRPAEPGARVMVLERVDQAPSARPSSPGRAAGEVIHPHGQIIRRPNIGRVLGVR